MEAKLKNGAITHQCGLFVFCLASLVVLTIWILGINGFGPIDDHRFISTIFQGKDFGAYVSPELGRFIPLTAQEYVLAAKVFEPSPNLFFVISAIKALLCGLLLLHCLPLTRAGNWTVAILWAVVIFSIGFANAAFRLQVGELNALLLILFFVWSTLASDKATLPLSTKQNIAAAGGLAAFTMALFYKELIFIFALAFGVSELLRHYRQTQAIIPRRIWALLIIAVCYIVFYGLWRAIYTTGSYASFHSIATWDVIRLYAINDPIIIFIVLPLAAFRVLLFIRDANKQTVYDSFLVAASAYVGAYLALGMYNTYYLLPAYGFAVCGVAGILASQSAIRFNTVVLAIAGLLGANTLPVALSDMQALKSIANNHYQFVRFLSGWLRANPLSNSERRNLVLAGVSPGNGVEVLLSLRAFLVSQGVQEPSFDIRAAEPTDNPVITSFYREKEHSLSVFTDDSGYTAKIGDLLIFNPYQSVVLGPPLSAPSFREVYRSGSEWALPRWSGWHWVSVCILSQHDCVSGVSGSKRYTGYAAMLVTRLAAPIQLAQLNSPSYRVGPLSLPSRMRAGMTQKRDVLIENTGKETWPANGTFSPGVFVHLAYVWINGNGQVALEGDRATFPEPMQPNDKAKVSILLKTPTHPGKYKLVISPVQEGVRWFYPDNGTNTAKEIDVF